jgi:hypothetical protein
MGGQEGTPFSVSDDGPDCLPTVSRAYLQFNQSFNKPEKDREKNFQLTSL